MKTLKKKKNQVKIQWLHIVSKNGNNSWEKKPPAKYFLLSIETWYTDKHSCTMYHSSKRKLRPYLMTTSVSQKKFFHIHASLRVKN